MSQNGHGGWHKRRPPNAPPGAAPKPEPTSFRLSVQPSGAHPDHFLVEVDSDTGEVRFGEAFSKHEIRCVTAANFGDPRDPSKSAMNPANQTQLTLLLISELIKLREENADLARRLGVLEAGP